MVAPQAASPVRHSSCTCAGMPNRLAPITCRCRSARARNPSPASTGAVPNGRVELAQSVGDELLPRPGRSHGVGQHGSHVTGRRVDAPDAGELGHLLAQRHPAQQVGHARGHGGAERRARARSRGRPGCGSGPTYDQGGAQRDVYLGLVLACDQPDQDVDGVMAHPPDRLLDGREGRVGQGGLRNVVETKDRQLRRHVQAELSGRLERSQSGQVVGREDGGRRLGEGQQRMGGGAGRLGLEPAGQEQRLVEGRPAAACASRKPCSRSWAEIRSGRPVTMPMRVWPRLSRWSTPRRAPWRLSAVTVGRLDGPVCGSTATIGPSNWTSVTVGVTRRAPSTRVPISRDRYGAPSRRARRCGRPPSRPPAHSPCPDRVGRSLEHLRAEGLEVGDQDADHVRTSVAQAPGDQAHLVAEAVDDLGDVLDGLVGHAVPAVDDLRHRRHRDVRLGGDLPHGHPAVDEKASWGQVTTRREVLESIIQSYPTCGGLSP